MKFNVFVKILSLLLAALMLLCLVSCGADEDDGIPENMQYATSEGALYRLFVPIGWNLMTDMGVSGGYASSAPENYAAVFVHDYGNPDALSAKEYAERVYLADVAAVYLDLDMASVKQAGTKLGGKSAYSLEYTGTRGLVTYRAREVLCVNEGRVYVLTFCTQTELFEGYADVYDMVKTNFRFDRAPYVADEPVNTVDPDADAPDGMKLASNDDVAYRFYVPDAWVLDKALPTSSAYVSESDRSNVNVTAYMPEAAQMTAEEYWDMCEKELSAVLGDYAFVSKTEGTLDGRPSNTYIYTATIGGTAYRFAQTVAAYRGMVYTVTYTALDETFEGHIDEYNDMLAAFDFRGN